MNRSAVLLALAVFVISIPVSVVLAKAQLAQHGYEWIVNDQRVLPILWTVSGIVVFLLLRGLKPVQVALWKVFALLAPRPESPASGAAHIGRCHEIRFDYLRNRSLAASPLHEGWKKGYGQGDPSFAPDPDIPGSLLMTVCGSFAMDYTAPQHAKLSDHITFTAKFISDAFFFTQIEVIDRNGQNPETLWFAHVIGQKSPEHLPQYQEWKFCHSPVNNRWEITLANEVAQVFGQAKVLSELKTIRLRGDLSISPIILECRHGTS